MLELRQEVGKIVRVKLTDTSEINIANRLKENGLTPIKIKVTSNLFAQSVKPEKKNKTPSRVASADYAEKAEHAKSKKGALKQDVQIPFLRLGSGIKYDEILAFTQSFHLLKKAGFTNVRALTTLLGNTTNPYLRDIISDILAGIESGEYIYSTMENYPKVFSPLYVNIVKVGELSDSLAESLAQALKSLEDNRDIKRKVRKAVTQPVAMILALVVMSIVAIVYGLPVMKNLYAELGVEDKIPAATLAFADFMEMVGNLWYIWVAVLGGLIAAFIAWYQTPNGRFTVDKFKYVMPIFGQLMFRLDLQKFLRAVQLNLDNNAKLSDSLDISKSVVKNYLFLAIVESAQNNLSQGLSWVEPFEQYDFMPNMITEMLKIGMETDIKTMMGKIVDYIEEDIDITIARIMAVIPQVSMAIAGVFLIGFVIIILKPIMEVYMGNFLFDAYGL